MAEEDICEPLADLDLEVGAAASEVLEAEVLGEDLAAVASEAFGGGLGGGGAGGSW